LRLTVESLLTDYRVYDISVQTEMSDKTSSLHPAVRSTILHWGELGTRWGINRTVAQVHMLLYLSETPLDAGAISELLEIARSNASTSIRELESWGLIRAVHLLGDRREHYEAISDVWEAFVLIVESRKRREIDPTLSVLRSCAADLNSSKNADPFPRKRIAELLEVLETIATLSEEFLRLPTTVIRGLGRFRGRLAAVLPLRKAR
jgi:DNA-binding transcriptional regulator GbsR (MarR family)